MVLLLVGMYDAVGPAAHRTGVVQSDGAAVPAQDGVVVDVRQVAVSGGRCQTKQIDAPPALASSENMVV